MKTLSDLGIASTHINTREDFIAFVDELAAVVERNPDEVAHSLLSEYLSAIAAWVRGMEGRKLRGVEPLPDELAWKHVAMILFSGTIYE